MAQARSKGNKTAAIVSFVIAGVIVVGFVAYMMFVGKRAVNKEVGELKLPVMAEADLNAAIGRTWGADAFIWKDLNSDKTFILKDGSIDEKEFSGKEKENVFIKKDGKYHFSKDFVDLYASMADELRKTKVAKELQLTVKEPIATDIIARLKELPGITNDEIAKYRDAVKRLLDAAPFIQKVYQEQVGASPDDRIAAETNDDREMIDRYGHPWCLADASEFCVAVPSFKKRASGVIGEGVKCEEAAKAGGPFDVVTRGEGGAIKTVPYAVAWADELKPAAAIIREAAAILAQVPREAKMAAYLTATAAAMENPESYPYADSDILWNDMMSSDSLLYARIGADEVGGDGVGDNCEMKARFHFNIGIRNQGANKIVDALGGVAQRFENDLAALIGQPGDYVAAEVKVHLPVFLDVVMANGDDVGGPSGTPIGQSLPNWCGKNGKGQCQSSTMIYVNKSLKAYSEDLISRYILPLFDPSLKDQFKADAGLESVVYHEVFHNIGPRDKKTKPGSAVTYGEKLIAKSGESWRLPLEELKAQTGSLFMATELYKDAKAKKEKGELDEAAFAEAEKQYKQHITYDMAWNLRMILRASRSGPEFASKSPYSRLAAVQVGFLTEKGALSYNDESKQWSIDFEKMPAAVSELMKKVGKLYASGDANGTEEMFLYYMKGDGEKLLHRDRIVEVSGPMPSVVFEYEIKGL